MILSALLMGNWVGSACWSSLPFLQQRALLWRDPGSLHQTENDMKWNKKTWKNRINFFGYNPARIFGSFHLNLEKEIKKHVESFPVGNYGNNRRNFVQKIRDNVRFPCIFDPYTFKVDLQKSTVNNSKCTWYILIEVTNWNRWHSGYTFYGK